jgi:hypothetical protein
MVTMQHKIFYVCEFIKTESQLTLLHGCALASALAVVFENLGPPLSNGM